MICCLSHDSITFLLVNGQLRTVKTGDFIDGIVRDKDGIFDCAENICIVGLGEDLRIKYSRVKRLIKTRASRKCLTYLWTTIDDYAQRPIMSSMC
jgi:hypothetical protein